MTIYTAFLPVVTNLGFGRHVYYLKPAKLIKFSRIFYIVNPFFNVASFFSRASFAMSLLMIMGTSLPRKAILWFTIAHQLVFHVIVLFIRQFRCNPIKKSWLIMIPGKCLGRSWIRIPSALYACEEHSIILNCRTAANRLFSVKHRRRSYPGSYASPHHLTA